MNERINDERLNDFVDGLLNEAEQREVEEYLETSVEARETVAFLQALRAQAAELPESIEPSRDLWPEIQERMAPAPLAEVAPGARAPQPEEARPWLPHLDFAQWGALAAAAVVLVALSSGITAWMVGTPVADPVINEPAATGVAMETPGAAYVLEIEQLRAELDANRGNLDPDTVSTIETNLRVIDRAIRRAREALEEDPGNTGLSRMLDNNYRHKLQLLQRANRIIELS